MRYMGKNNKGVKQSAHRDKRERIDKLTGETEEAARRENSRELYKLTK